MTGTSDDNDDEDEDEEEEEVVVVVVVDVEEREAEEEASAIFRLPRLPLFVVLEPSLVLLLTLLAPLLFLPLPEEEEDDAPIWCVFACVR